MNIRAKVVVGAILGLVASAAAAGAADAAPVRYPVDVVVHTVFGSEGAEFEANIPGCESGVVTEAGGGAHFTPWGGSYVGLKEFTCDGDDTGGFLVRLNARFGEFGSQGTWTLVDAWGAYEGIKGSGTLTGTPTGTPDVPGIDDHYTGTAR